MERFGGLFGVFLIVVVTAAQLAGNRKRNRDKDKAETLDSSPHIPAEFPEDAPAAIPVEAPADTPAGIPEDSANDSAE